MDTFDYTVLNNGGLVCNKHLYTKQQADDLYKRIWSIPLTDVRTSTAYMCGIIVQNGNGKTRCFYSLYNVPKGINPVECFVYEKKKTTKQERREGR